jgi:NADH dehydrogenase
MTIVVTGASGFVGAHLVKALSAAGHRVVALSRGGEAPAETVLAEAVPAETVLAETETRDSVTAAKGEVTSGEGLAEAFHRADAVIHLVGIIRETKGASFERVHVEGTRQVLAAARQAGVTRFVHMSALGADERSESRYRATKAQAERLVRASGLKWTVFRPSLIFGPGDDFFGNILRRLVTGYPLVIPQIGRGDFPFRPVWIGDVVSALAQSLAKPETVGQSYELVGPREYRFAELLERVKAALGSNKPRFPVPVALMRLAVPLMQVLPEPPITPDQFRMLLAGNTADPAAMRATFALEWRSLETELPRILARA